MLIYISELAVTVILASVLNRLKASKWLTVILVSIPLVCIAGFRWKVGTDFVTYYSTFTEIPNYSLSFLFGKTYSDFIPYERGFSLLVWIIGLINKNPQFIIFITSLINVVIVVVALKKYSRNFSLSIYLYVTSMIYFSTFNGIRQWIASVIIFIAFKYLINRDLKKYLIFVLITSMIHISSLIMIPVYFIVNFKPFGKKIIIIVVIIGIISVLLQPILQNLEVFTTDTRYSEYMNVSEEDDGVNIFRVLVAAVPVIISFIFYNKLKDDKENRFLINFATLNFLVLFLAMQSTIIARLTMYFELYNLLLYPKIVKVLKKEEAYVFIFILCLCFFIYMCMLLPVDSNLLPYRTFWNK